MTEARPVLCDEDGCDKRVVIVTLSPDGLAIDHGWCMAHIPDRYRMHVKL